MDKSTAPYIVVYPRGQLSAKDKERLTKHGILAIEADDPKSVFQLQLQAQVLTMPIIGDDFVAAAIHALAQNAEKTIGNSRTSADVARTHFVEALSKSISSKKGTALDLDNQESSK